MLPQIFALQKQLLISVNPADVIFLRAATRIPPISYTNTLVHSALALYLQLGLFIVYLYLYRQDTEAFFKSCGVYHSDQHQSGWFDPLVEHSQAPSHGAVPVLRDPGVAFADQNQLQMLVMEMRNHSNQVLWTLAHRNQPHHNMTPR